MSPVAYLKNGLGVLLVPLNVRGAGRSRRPLRTAHSTGQATWRHYLTEPIYLTNTAGHLRCRPRATQHRSSRSCTPSRSRHRAEVMHEMERSFAKRAVAVASPQLRFSICSSNDLRDFSTARSLLTPSMVSENEAHCVCAAAIVQAVLQQTTAIRTMIGRM